MTSEDEDTQTQQVSSRRKLPEDPHEQHSVLQKYRPMAEIIIGSVNATLKVSGKLSKFDIPELDKAERDGGCYAASAVLFERGADISGTVLAVIWGFGILTPRLLAIAAQLDERRENRSTKVEGSTIERIREVSGERVA